MTKITVFTPTFNRLNTLPLLYLSLLKQSSFDFEWLVVDDGSTDGTDDYFTDLLKSENKFKIKYYKFENGGKHRAINQGIKYASGEYIYIVDSDDRLTEDSIELVLQWISEIPKEDKCIIGVSGLKGYTNNNIVGKTFRQEFVDCTALERERYNIYGDKSEVYKTSVLLQYKFPEINGEKFITEAVVWNRMAFDGYKLRYFNKINYICEYREDGITKRSDDFFSNNFQGYTLYIKELLTYKLNLKIKIRAIMAYTYRGRIVRISYKDMSQMIGVSEPFLFIFNVLGSIYKKISNLKKRGR